MIFLKPWRRGGWQEPNCRAPRREAAVPGEDPGGDHDCGRWAAVHKKLQW